MEFKSEYRRLLLLIVPFIVLLAIHVATPLSFFLLSQPQLIQDYTDGNANNMVKSLRSYTITEGRSVTYQLGKYITNLKMLTSQFSSTYYAMNIKTSSISLNNAFEYYESTLQTNTSDISMWFAPNVTSITQLSAGQKQNFQKYLQIEPYIRSTLSLNDPIIQGFFVSTNTVG
jgi:hypothetical protein